MKGVLLMNTVEDKVNIIDARNNEFLKEEFFRQNLSLVYHVAYKLKNLPFDDDEKISLGHLGLIKAFENYDEKSGWAFSTYACKCIKNEILMENRKSIYKRKFQSLEEAIVSKGSKDEITLKEIIPTEEEEYNKEDIDYVIEAYKKFVDVYSKKDPQLIEAFNMIIFNNKTTKDVADKFNLVQSSGSRMLQRAIKALQEIAIEMEIIDGFNKYNKRSNAPSDYAKKSKERDNKVKQKALYIIINYPELDIYDISKILSWNPAKVSLLKISHNKGTFKLSPDDSIKLKVEKYLANKNLYS